MAHSFSLLLSLFVYSLRFILRRGSLLLYLILLSLTSPSHHTTLRIIKLAVYNRHIFGIPFRLRYHEISRLMLTLPVWL